MVGKNLSVGAVGILLLSFLVGSVPTSNLVARVWRGVDLREVGGGTVAGTSLYRVAGFVPLAAGGILDIGKGALGPLLAGHRSPGAGCVRRRRRGDRSQLVAVPRGAGGRGIAPAIGALLVNAWPGAVLVLGGPMVGRWFGQTGLGGFIAEVSLTPVLAITDGRDGAIAGVCIAVPMIVKRVVGNSRPAPGDGRSPGHVYLHRLLFDHDPSAGTQGLS